MKWIPWLLILPVVLIRGFTTLYPILMTVKNSFFNISILAGINEFIGFKNYLKVFLILSAHIDSALRQYLWLLP